MDSSDQVEVEVKFAVDASTPIPNFSSVGGVVSVGTERYFSLSATYYDTPDLQLTRKKITLRRRRGGPDEGWHLKLPGQHGRREVHAPLDAGEFSNPHQVYPPHTLIDVLTKDIPTVASTTTFIAIAQVDNERHITDIMVNYHEATPATHHNDAHQTTTSDVHKGAEFCDDHVTSRGLLPGGVTHHWREWEIELSSTLAQRQHANNLLDRLSQHTTAAGARISTSPSKLVMAMGDTMPS
ncbi:CYTH domain-containing protein [Corynebacterium kroppenstedtii]|uniref:CYTH domain-containing protein n=1 Tax=Corynebacterium sp. PCR 32 TaxID=3351342 RepID=UPI00309C3D0F